MTAILEGIYKQGNIELLEAPADLAEGRVRVIVIGEVETTSPPRNLTFGKYNKATMSIFEDFKDAEWRGEEECDDGHG